VPLLTELTLKFTREDLLSALEKQGVPAGPINTVADVFADPQVLARGMKIDLPSPVAKGGAIPSVRSPIVMNGQAMAAGRPSPRLGEHTDEVLSDPSWMA
jgi:crotonobetainyl-CoA:carnitine CoA-transferase CaiB-like acyl-CoA transferase